MAGRNICLSQVRLHCIRLAGRPLIAISSSAVAESKTSVTMPSSDSDLSPPRRRPRPASDSDASPPRRPRPGADVGRSEVGEGAEPAPASRPRAGLFSAAEIVREAQEAREASAREREAEAARAAREKARALTEARERAKVLRSGGASVGGREGEGERNLGLGVTRDDGGLNREQRQRGRWGDPMAKKAAKGGTGGQEADDEDDEVYSGPAAPPNRFGILPGPRWDGVDRTNGFEGRLANAAVAKSVREKEKYREDMSGI